MGADPGVVTVRPTRAEPAARAGGVGAPAVAGLPRVSVVVPVYNERESLPHLQRELARRLESVASWWEIVYVDDGSTDGSDEVLASLLADQPRCRAFRFHHNQGKAAAYNVGFRRALGDVVLTLDADLQDDPDEIPSLLARLSEGYDLVVGWKQGRARNEPLKKLPSWVFNRIKGRIFGLRLHDSNCGLRAMRGTVARELDLYAGNYRFLPELAHQCGFRVTEVPVRHRRRRYGASKYGPGRFVSGVLDLVSLTLLAGFAHRPLHFFGAAGLVPMLLGAGLEMYVLVRKIMGDPFQSHVAAIIIGVMLILLGFQLIGIGLVGEFVLARSRRSRAPDPHHVPIARGGGESASAGGARGGCEALRACDIREVKGGRGADE